MNTRPSLQEWKKHHPGRSIHEYYEEYPEDSSSRFHVPAVSPVPFPIPPKKKEKSINYLNMLATLLVGVGFMMPWVKVELFGSLEGITEGTGYHLSDILLLLIKDMNEIVYESILLVPIGAFSVFLGEILKSWLIKLMGQIAVIAVYFYWAFLIYQMVQVAQHELKIEVDYLQVFGFGFYLTGIAVLYYMYDVFFGK